MKTIAELVEEIFDESGGDSMIRSDLSLREVCELEGGALEEDPELMGWWRYTFQDGSRLAGTEQGLGVAS